MGMIRRLLEGELLKPHPLEVLEGGLHRIMTSWQQREYWERSWLCTYIGTYVAHCQLLLLCYLGNFGTYITSVFIQTAVKALSILHGLPILLYTYIHIASISYHNIGVLHPLTALGTNIMEGSYVEADTAASETPANNRDNLRIGAQSELMAESGRETASFKPSFRMYAIIVGLGITNLLAALENTVVSVAAPVLLTDLQLGDNFIWITNALFLSRYMISCLSLIAFSSSTVSDLSPNQYCNPSIVWPVL